MKKSVIKSHIIIFIGIIFIIFGLTIKGSIMMLSILLGMYLIYEGFKIKSGRNKSIFDIPDNW